MNALAPHPALRRKPEAQSLLCNPVVDWKGAVPAGGAIVEPKIDGMRALWIDGEICSREGSPIYGVEHIARKLRAIEHEACVQMFFDGEFQVGGAFGPTISHFQSAGIEGPDAGTLFLFDAVPMRVWRGDDPCEALEVRRGKLDRMAAPHVGPELQVLPWAFMTDAGEIQEKARELIGAGGEGILVKHALSTYRRTGSAAWQRIRKTLTLDVPVVAVTPHRVNEGLLGALVVDLEGVRVKVPGGYSDAERRELWAMRDRLPGAIVEVQAMERTARGSLRQCVFVRMRPDKGGCHAEHWN